MSANIFALHLPTSALHCEAILEARFDGTSTAILAASGSESGLNLPFARTACSPKSGAEVTLLSSF